MPFSGPSSYLSTIDEFNGHWIDVDTELGGGGPLILLPGSYSQTDLEADRDALAALIDALVVATNVVEGHRTARDNQKESVKERGKQLDGYIRGVLPHTIYVGRIPDLIAFDANSGKWGQWMTDHVNIWTLVNANSPAVPGFTPPLVLNDGYALANFTTDTTALALTFQNLHTSEQFADDALQARDELYRAIRDRLIAYRVAVTGYFPDDHPLVLSLPRLDPLPGHTPDAVVLEGEWNEETNQADFSWNDSTDPDLDHYELRRDSPPYSGNTEIAVATIPAGTTVFSTNAGLPVPSSTMAFRVYVVLNTSNEAGSNAVTVTRL